MTLNAIHWRHHGVGLLLAALQLSMLVATNDQVGIPRDESFYFYAADRAGDWVLGLFDGEVESFSREQVDRGFKYNHEHPVLMKMLFGVSHHVLHDRLELLDSNMLAYRFPTMLLAALAVWLTFLLGRMVAGTAAGVVAGLALTFMPRVFFHAHLACFDAPVTFMWLLVCYTFLRATRSRRWAIASGVAVGLGLATKLNIFFVPFALLGVAALDTWAYKRRTGAWKAPEGERGPLTCYTWVAASMLVLGLGVFLAHWPWLWFDTVPRLKAYYAFHARHEHYPVDYLGTLYFAPPFPVHFPFVFTLFSVPVATLALGAVGFVEVVRRFVRQLRDPSDPDRRGAEAMLLVNALVPPLVIALPFTPIFGGTKHWMPAMPFLSVMAGVAAVRMGRGLWRAAAPARQAALGAGVAVAMLLPAAWATLAYGPHGPAYYNTVAGGPPGAAAMRMPRNFWGYSTIAVLPFLDEAVEKNGLVFWHNATAGSVRAYQRDGLLRKDIRYSGDWTVPSSDWGVYHDQREKLPEETDLWRAYGTDWPVDGYFLDGVQLIGVYHRPAPPALPTIPPGGR
ncbi:MAG: glycosyltransferase family 39 protein [Myxococcales bacterium]|nr:glycosyltransferase family 39 protein [Myxococcales bacterium]